MTKTLIRHAIPADFESLLAIDVSSFPGGVAYDATELAYFYEPRRSGNDCPRSKRENRRLPDYGNPSYTSRCNNRDVGRLRERTAKRVREPPLKRSEEMLLDYGVEAYDLQVDVTNAGAIVFYKKHGFETVKTLRKYYANGNDAFLMVKEL